MGSTREAASALAAWGGFVPGWSCGRSGQGEGEDLDGIEPDALPAHGEVQVRACDAARRARKADFVTLLELVAFFYVRAREVQVDREEAFSVIDDDHIPFIEEVAGEDDDAGVGDEHGRAFLDLIIGAGVQACFFLV